MKKFSVLYSILTLILALSIIMCVCICAAYAEGAPAIATEPTTVWDWTPVATSIINLVNLLVIWVVTTLIRPWLEKHNLYDAAAIAVNAAEATIGRYHGKEKLEAAITYMSAHGFDVDTQKVMDALHQAWENLNNSQVAVGTKTDFEPITGDAMPTDHE